MKRTMTFDELFEHFKTIYGRNNKIYYTSLAQHTDTLRSRIRSLRMATRKHRGNKRMLEERMGQVIARIFAVAGFFYRLPLNEFMCRKFPTYGCAYCGDANCECSTVQREPHTEVEPSSEQLLWTIGEHQRSLAVTYEGSNTELGLDTCFAWLGDEVGEITDIANQQDHTNARASEIEKAYAREIADVFAWTLGIATLLEIDVEKVVMNMYGNGCPYCSSMTCECTRYKIHQGEIVTASSRLAS